MPLHDIQEFLDHEHTNFLLPALNLATQNATVACQLNPGDTVCNMWQGWVEYYNTLISKNRAMRTTWHESDFQNNLDAEINAISTLKKIIEDWVKNPKLDGKARRCVINLGDLLDIEREATELMRQQVP